MRRKSNKKYQDRIFAIMGILITLAVLMAHMLSSIAQADTATMGAQSIQAGAIIPNTSFSDKKNLNSIDATTQATTKKNSIVKFKLSNSKGITIKIARIAIPNIRTSKISIPRIKTIKIATIKLPHEKGMTLKYIKSSTHMMSRMNSSYKLRNTRY